RKLSLSNALGTGQWQEGNAFLEVQLSKYWTASPQTKYSSWYVDIYNGLLDTDKVNIKYYVWPVRGGD
ncbi:MAG: hypothetical protein IMF12_10090, partial [Proteobacteria bacterium]|nr:hypothetical protein [Pseudomonadota bacterium]